MITPQLTEQYGQVLRVSVVRSILSVLAWAYAGATSKPNADNPAPPMTVVWMKALLEICMGGLMRWNAYSHPSRILRGRRGAGLQACQRPRRRPEGMRYGTFRPASLCFARKAVKHRVTCDAHAHAGSQRANTGVSPA